MTYLINIFNVERESEKAVLINCPVCWGEGCMKQKSMWFPKSVIVRIDERCAEIKDWFIHKTESANTWNGYQMEFDRI